MTTAHALWLFAYDEWTNARYFEALSQLTHEQLTQKLTSSFPTLLQTALHIVDAEWVWLERWRGNSPRDVPPWHDDPQLPSLRVALVQIETERRAFLQTQPANGLAKVLRYELLSGRAYENQLGVLVQHVVNHSSFHRGQLATMMRQVGATPPGTDMDDFGEPMPD